MGGPQPQSSRHLLGPPHESVGRQMFTQEELTQVRGTTQDFWGRECGKQSFRSLRTVLPAMRTQASHSLDPNFFIFKMALLPCRICRVLWGWREPGHITHQVHSGYSTNIPPFLFPGQCSRKKLSKHWWEWEMITGVARDKRPRNQGTNYKPGSAQQVWLPVQ